MRTALRSFIGLPLFVITMLVMLPMASLSGCAALGLSGQVTGASAAEQVNLRLIQANDVVTAAAATVKDQLAKGVISVDQAKAAQATIEKARTALNAASAAVAGGLSTAPQLLTALDAVLLEVLRAQAAAK